MPGPDIQAILRTASKVNLKGGVVGKVCLLALIAVLAITAVAFATKIAWGAEFAGSLIFVLVIAVVWRVTNFANKNPQAALLEGAEFLVHQQLVLAQKGHPEIPAGMRELGEETSSKGTPKVIAEASEPDGPVTASQSTEERK